ncbi:MAG: GatB/YqeY domain-containing protein [Phycisphaerae bacterium]|nr:GatB/YqeY domain-containing protein [Phycisphaerae bacterium]
MTLAETIKEQIMQAMKQKLELEKNILRVALGEIQRIETRQGSITEAEAQKALRKLIASNKETIAAAPEKDNSDLLRENQIIEALLPQLWDQAKITEFLSSDEDALAGIRSAGGDGQATGVAMKSLKAAGAAVNGKDVAAVVGNLRNG